MRLEEIFIVIAEIGLKTSVHDSFHRVIEMSKKLIHQSWSEKCICSVHVTLRQEMCSVHVTLGQEMLKVADMRSYL